MEVEIEQSKYGTIFANLYLRRGYLSGENSNTIVKYEDGNGLVIADTSLDEFIETLIRMRANGKGRVTDTINDEDLLYIRSTALKHATECYTASRFPCEGSILTMASKFEDYLKGVKTNG